MTAKALTLAHYGVVADPARVRGPNRKGTVEHAIGHTQATALKGRRFESIEEQNEFLAHWERNWTAKRTHTKAERPGTVVLHMQERVFNPSRETRLILRQAGEIGEHADRLCQLLFAIEGRVGPRKLWGIVGLERRYKRSGLDEKVALADFDWRFNPQAAALGML